MTAVVASLSEDDTTTIPELLAATVGTALIFWVAHVYADLLALRVTGTPWSWTAFREEAFRQWPIAQAAAPATLALVMGMTGDLDEEDAAYYAIGAGIVALFGWGFAIGRLGGQGRWGCFGSGLLNALFGMLIVGLKVVVH